MRNVPTVDVDRPPSTLGERMHIWPILKGLAVTLRHFLRNLAGHKDVATIQYPEETHFPMFRDADANWRFAEFMRTALIEGRAEIVVPIQ